MDKTLATITRETTTDPVTGEKKDEFKKATYKIGAEPLYIKIYVRDILYLQDLPAKLYKLVLSLLKRMSYASAEEGMCVHIDKHIKEIIRKEIGWKSTASIDNAVQLLLKGKILYRVSRGCYRFNPYLFGCGNWADIATLRMQIDYDQIKGRTFKTNVEYNNPLDGIINDVPAAGQSFYDDLENLFNESNNKNDDESEE